MEKIWLKSYPPGVPAEINPDVYSSLVEMFDKTCKLYPTRPAFYNFGTTLTYTDIDEYSRDFAAYLQNELHLQRGDRLAIMLPNLLQYPIVLFGAWRAGVTVVNVNPLYTADELTRQLNDSGAQTLITATNFASTVEKALPKTSAMKNIIITHIGDMLPRWKAWLFEFALKYIHKKIPKWHLPGVVYFRDVLDKGRDLSFTPVLLNNQDIALLQYTGGTTGVSKGAILTHRNLITNIQQADAWFQNLRPENDEIIITALPLYHIFSLTANCLFFVKIGALNVLITNPRDVPTMVKEIGKFRFTAITGVNTLFNALLKNPQFKKLDFSRLKLALGGGMAVQHVVADKWQEVARAPLLEAYGLTETSPCVTINPPTLKAFNGSIGLPVPSTDVCIMDDNKQPLPIGQEGELAVKGPQVMRGYWNNPIETAKVFTEDGWLLTGDMAAMDEHGFVRLLERKKDMILVSGFNVYPNEIEDVIASMPGVKEVAVISVPDDNSGEAPKAFIVKDSTAITTADVIAYCRTHLTSYKIPRHIEFINELPKSNVGKILRRALRA